MHDHSIMVSLMRKIEGIAQANDARRVTAVRVRLGALSHMSSQHFREHFALASRDSVAQEALIEVEESQDLLGVFLVDVELER
jgi:hydrogenase nickel incorporation protein HypA/HybF